MHEAERSEQAVANDDSPALLRSDEAERLEALERYDLLDTPREETFDRIVRLAKRVFDVPIAYISLIDGHRQWLKAQAGLTGQDVPRSQAFCSTTIQQNSPLVVEDAAMDPRFSTNPLVTGDLNIRFYAGVPLRSRDGHPVGTLCLADRAARPFDADQLGALLDLAHLAMDEFELRMLVGKDSLTGALSRRAFKEQAQRAIALAQRHKQDLSCLVLDLDHFKSINDRLGHPAGDLVLAGAVKACASTLRETDLFGRLGGEEFGVILPETKPGGAMAVAEKLRTAIADATFKFEAERIRVTASIGTAFLGPHTKTLDDLLQHADTALYNAKREGRNRCVLWREGKAATIPGQRRTLKAARIYFNRRHSSMDCTVRSLSDEGAGLDVSSTVGVPQLFDLAIRAESGERRCRVLSRTGQRLDVAFC